MTKREMFATAIAMIETVDAENKAEVVDALKHEIELLDNRAANKKPSKKQTENDSVMDAILEVLAVADAPMTVGELRQHENLAGYTSQKISALLRNLKLAGKVDKEYDKKVAKFSIVR